MEIDIYNSKKSFSLPYEELKIAFNNFEFLEKELLGHGKLRYSTSSNRWNPGYASVVLTIATKKNPSTLIWKVSDKQIPIIYFDTILSTIKEIYMDKSQYLSFSIIGGTYHPIDTWPHSYEIATFLALADLIEFKHDRLNALR